jgi:hypothetical protein
VPAAPAWARERPRCGYSENGGDRYGCDDYGGQGNRNRQDRHQGRDDNHKSFSPDLKDSPTTLVFCLPGSTCNFDGSQDKNKKGGDQGQQPSEETAGPDLLCIVKSLPYHCDPKP